MAVLRTGKTVQQLTFGHATAAAAKAAIHVDLLGKARQVGRNDPLAVRLRAYAAGVPDSFRDVRVESGRAGGFWVRVLEQCRRIPYGTTMTYSELAAKAGCPRAARAVGNCMASNRVPLLVPCHRVVRSDGRLGFYSASGGVDMKRRLLDIEASDWPRIV
jgi:methylated-DNA-[protein]-cysteine S-methyltransferase